MSNNNNFKWSQSSQNAFKLVGSFFGIDPNSLATVKDNEAKKLILAADASDTQLKRTQDAANAVKKTLKNRTRIGAILHGLARVGLGHILTTRTQEAQTSKVLAKTITATSVLSAKTQNAVERTYLKGEKDIKKSGADLQRYQTDLNEQYSVAEETANQQSNTRRLSYRDKAQKRLASNSRPWRP